MSCKAAAHNLRQIILNIDLFGQPPSFRIFGKQKFNTTLGALLTLIVLFFTCAYLYVGIQELIAQNSPNVLQSDRQVIETSPFPLLRNNFTIAITLADLNSQPLTTINKYFTISLKNCKTTRVINETTKAANVTRNCTEIPLEACTKDHFLSQTQIDYFSLIRLGAVQCIQKDYWDAHPPVLQGIKTSPLYQSLTVQVSVCQNTTNKTDCAPIEDIKKQLSSGFYGVHMSDSLLQMEKPGNVALDIINLQFNTFSLSSSKQIIQQFKVIDTYTDTGLVFNDYSQQQALIQDTNRESADLYNNQYIVLHNIYLSSKYSQYTRSYVKIQGILSRVGGLYQMIFLILAGFIKGIVQLLLDIDMANEIYRFNNEKNLEVKQQQRRSLQRNNVVDGLAGIMRSRRKLNSPRESGRLNSGENELNEMVSQTQKQEMSEYILKKDQIGRGFRRVFLTYIGCDKRTKRTLEIAKEKYMNQLDIKNIIKKLYEIDQLKKVILTDEQEKLFGFLPKPKIIEEQLINPLNSKMQSEQLPSQQLQEGYEAFAKLLSQGKKTQVDLKIISSLDPDIFNIYQSVQKASGTCNQFLNDYPLNQSKMKLDQANIIDSLQDIHSERDTPQKVYVKLAKIQK